MREPKFNFISEDQIKKASKARDCEYRVTLMRVVAKVKQEDGTVKSTPNYYIYFPRDVVNIYDLKGKKIEFVVEPVKKVIGWKISDKFTPVETLPGKRSKGFVKPNVAGAWVGSITKLVNFAKLDIPESRSGVPVKKHKSQSEYLGAEEVFYIEL